MSTSFVNKVVVITGAGLGMGRLLAIGAAQRGARVAIWDIDAVNGESVRAEVGDQARFYQVDVTDKEAVKKAADQVAADFGRVDIIINNAGVVSGRPLSELTDEQIERTLGVNTLSLFWVTRAFLPYLRKRSRAKIVTTASAAGLIAPASMTDYSASKFAAVGFMDALRAELTRDHKENGAADISTLTVTPYYISTGMFDGVTTKFPALLPILSPEYAVKRILRFIECDRQRLMMPRFIVLTALAKLSPPIVSDHVLNFLGLNHAMDNFQGRQGKVEK
ncbi:MAG: SDR family oxidoreductase [Propionibacteriaceae bacterium]|jgi:all-trans-retinol dehydrogenase (NAD+)|nr:SDR family oxidoreductase [Propionibacteriaceae bacterium]